MAASAAALAAGLAVAAAQPAERAARMADLVTEVGRADWVQAQHLAAALPPMQARAALDDELRAPRMALLILGGDVIELWPFLGTFATLAGSQDRPVAAAAARAVARLSERLAAGQAELWDVPHGELVAAYRRCAQVAARPGAWPDVRADAAACALTLGEYLGAPHDLLAETVTRPLRESPDPEVRLAAVWILSPAVSTATRDLLAPIAVSDADLSVASAALAALCLADGEDALARVPAARLAELRAAEPEAGAEASLGRCTAP